RNLGYRYYRRRFGSCALKQFKSICVYQVFKSYKANCKRTDNVFLCDKTGDCRRRKLPGKHSHNRDRKSTRLNSSHVSISYAVFCPHSLLGSFPTRRSSDLATLVIAIIDAASAPVPSSSSRVSASIRFSSPTKQTASVPTTFSFAIKPVTAAAASCQESTPTIEIGRAHV